MQCEEIVNEILSDDPLRDEVKSHLDRCEECRRLKDAVRACEQLGAEERRADISTFTAASVLRSAHQIQAERLKAPHTRMMDWWIIRGLAAAALFVLIAGGAILAFHYVFFDKKNGASDEIRLDSGELAIEFAQIRRDLSAFAVRYESGMMPDGAVSGLNQLRNRMERSFADLDDDFYGIN